MGTKNEQLKKCAYANFVIPNPSWPRNIRTSNFDTPILFDVGSHGNWNPEFKMSPLVIPVEIHPCGNSSEFPRIRAGEMETRLVPWKICGKRKMESSKKINSRGTRDEMGVFFSSAKIYDLCSSLWDKSISLYSDIIFFSEGAIQDLFPVAVFRPKECFWKAILFSKWWIHALPKKEMSVPPLQDATLHWKGPCSPSDTYWYANG